MIVDGCRIQSGVAGHGSNRGRIEALPGEELLCRIENQDYRANF
jgi:hypothetical protein